MAWGPVELLATTMYITLVDICYTAALRPCVHRVHREEIVQALFTIFFTNFFCKWLKCASKVLSSSENFDDDAESLPDSANFAHVKEKLEAGPEL